MINQLLRTELTGWTLRATGGPVPSEIAGRDVPVVVPGTSHTALLDAGLIDDPYVGDAEERLAWMREAAWRFTTPLALAPVSPDERVDLVLDGVDTLATIRLGDVELGRTANMHRGYRFDVRALADGTERDLTVDLESALVAGLAEAERIGARPAAYDRPINMVRKMACSFGWDWGPDLETAGLWKPVAIERWRVARLATVRPVVEVDEDGTARVSVHVDVERSGLQGSQEATLDLTADLTGASGPVHARTTIAAGETSASIELTVPDAALWWPVGFGDPVLHDLTIGLSSAAGSTDPEESAAAERHNLQRDTAPIDTPLLDTRPLDSWQRRIGLRTVALDTTPDEHGTPFTLVVNGRPLFVRGANWIPDDHLLTRITRERLAERVDAALGANLNLLRVWGGGIYESDDFYDVCDERGVMVWQDFLLACAAYPEEEPHRSEFEAEARDNVVRLMPHPSLVLWNGGNENLWGFMDWGWQDELDGRSWGYDYYTQVFPSVLAELDPSRPYAQGSPYSPGTTPWGRHPNDPDHGTHHQWEVWNRVDYSVYRDEVPRFCSEFGFQGPPTWATLERAVRPADGVWSKDDPVWLLHQKAEDGNGKLDRGMTPHLGLPEQFDAWVWAAQLNQARAVAHAVEHYRSWWPRTAGAIVWQLNDCWPVTSWAAIDGDGRFKPLWFSLRRAFADRALAVVERDGRPCVAVVNDTDEVWVGELVTTRTTLDGTPLESSVLGSGGTDEGAPEGLATPVSVRPRSVELVPVASGAGAAGTDAATDVVLTVTLGDARLAHLVGPDVEAALDADPLDAEVRRVADGFEVEVRARSAARGVTLLVDRVWPTARVDDGVVDLAAGWRHVFRVTFDGPVPADADERAGELASTGVLRTGNELVRVMQVSEG